MRQFLWQGSSGRGYAKVSWLRICSPKTEGGLGIRRVLHLNQALMLKQVWRILQEDEQSIWVQWVLTYRLRTQTMIGDGRKFKLWTDP
ncbi:UNVERIFIED_CONTAM: putative ribonuclease H protein [Sesamum latifolium]|uniref:Ribonuclease H protein n=1 Tax=Sesamum latifolium TaxID=2727402 RepID=A0AAW2XUK7_9LAMI